MDTIRQTQARHAQRNFRHFAELLHHTGDLAGAEQARKDAVAAKRDAVRFDKPVRYRPVVARFGEGLAA